MKCDNCKITVLDNTDCCPLCRQVLTKQPGETGHDMYPNVGIANKKFHKFENIFLFASIVAESVLLYINFSIDTSILWSILTLLILIYVNAVIRVVIAGTSGYITKTLSMFIIAIAVLLAIDGITGYRGWAIDYVFPGGILVIDIGIGILMIVNRKNWQSYMTLQLFMTFVSAISVILAIFDVIDFPPLANISFAFSFFLFLGTLIIGDARARSELVRRFHIK